MMTLHVDVGRVAMAGRYAEIGKTVSVFKVCYVTADSQNVFPSPILRIYSVLRFSKTTSSERINFFAN